MSSPDYFPSEAMAWPSNDHPLPPTYRRVRSRLWAVVCGAIGHEPQPDPEHGDEFTRCSTCGRLWHPARSSRAAVHAALSSVRAGRSTAIAPRVGAWPRVDFNDPPVPSEPGQRSPSIEFRATG